MIAVICEFNPFHNGHKYIIERVKALTGEAVLAIMSGSFTQRGEVAVCSKFERAETALENGADLVAELPTVYAVARADRFAGGGVRIAQAFSDVHALAFGCETDDLTVLQAAADALKSPEVNALVAAGMKSGEVYPRAFQNAVEAVCGKEVGAALASPNNILAVEYLRALSGGKVKPMPVRRVGAAHDSAEYSGGFASASMLRGMLRAGKSPEAFMPSVPREITRPELLERAVLMKLRSMTAADFAVLPEVGEGLENRLFDAVRKNNSVGEIIDAVKTKRYTRARLRRVIACAVLDITEELQARRASYCRVLGMTDSGAGYLKNCGFRVVTSVAKTLGFDTENADFLRRDILATDLAALAYERVRPCAQDYLTKIISKNSAK